MHKRPTIPCVTVALAVALLVSYVLVLERGLGQDVAGPGLRRQWVHLDPWSIWSGGYWSMLTAAFVHYGMFVPFGLVHLVLNLTGLAMFGWRVERTLGAAPMLALLLFGALCGSAAALATGEWPSLGASPMLLAPAGMLMATHRRHYLFAEIVALPHLRSFMRTWLVLVLGLGVLGLTFTSFKAQVAGFLFGYLAGQAFGLSRPRPWAFPGIGALAALVLVSATWLPWVPAWRIWDFQRLVKAGEVDAAMRGIEPLLAEPADPTVLNAVAWTLATSYNDAVRDGKRAVELATEACRLTEWREPSYLDTLAAAHAEIDDWEAAERFQRMALDTARDLKYRAEIVEIFRGNLREIEARRKIRE